MGTWFWQVQAHKFQQVFHFTSAVWFACALEHVLLLMGIYTSIPNAYSLLKTNNLVPYPAELRIQALSLPPKHPVNDHLNGSTQLGISSVRRGVLQLLLKMARFVLVCFSRKVISEVQACHKEHLVFSSLKLQPWDVTFQTNFSRMGGGNGEEGFKIRWASTF